jgi:hypothetical protein
LWRVSRARSRRARDVARSAKAGGDRTIAALFAYVASGFARFLCDGCSLDRLVPFSCKGRGVLSKLRRPPDGRMRGSLLPLTCAGCENSDRISSGNSGRFELTPSDRTLAASLSSEVKDDLHAQLRLLRRLLAVARP